MKQNENRTPNAKKSGRNPRKIPLLLLAIFLFGLTFWVLSSGKAQAPTVGTGSSAASGSNARFIYTEQQGKSVIFWQASAIQPEGRQEVFRIADETGYGAHASLSPDKTKIACLVNLPQARDVYGAAQVWLFDLGNSQKKELLDGVDINATPIWSPSGNSLLLRRTVPVDEETFKTEIIAVSLDEPEKRSVLVADSSGVGLYTIGWSSDGSNVYYTTIGRQGTDLREVNVSSGVTRTVRHLSDVVARDYQLSPDHTWLAFTTTTSQGENAIFSVQAVSLTSGERIIVKEGPNDHFKPIWAPDSRTLTINTLNQSNGVTNGIATVGLVDRSISQIAESTRSTFETPISWSADSRVLVARSFTGLSSQEISKDQLVVLTADGTMKPIPASGYTDFVGWLGVSD